MHRFRKEEIAAAKAALSVPATPFSWSVSRHLLFEKCRRAYFHHYYFAQGGWDPYADPLMRSAWTAKKNLSGAERLTLELEALLRSSFDSLRNTNPLFRLKILSNRFAGGLLALEKRREESGIQSEEEIRLLKGALTEFLRTDTCRILSGIPNLTLFHKAFQPSFSWNGIEVWYNPGLIWREGADLASLRFGFLSYSEAFCQAEADTFALSARTSVHAENTISFFRFPDPATGEWTECSVRGDAAAGAERVEQDRKQMLELIHEEQACMLDFPAVPDAPASEICAECRFSGVCAAAAEQFGLL